MLQQDPVRPRRLVPGDLVALVSPSGAIQPQRIAAATAVLTGWGLRVRPGAHAGGRHAFFAGTDQQRLADLDAAFGDPEVRAVLCLRGGYGMQRIVDAIDFAAVRADPKLVMGFSDITALHVALWCEARLATVHGPTGGQFDRGPGSLTVEAARRALMSAEPVTLAASPAETTYAVRAPGRAEGPLVGGNLAMLAATVGTRHAVDPKGAVLLLEDVNEEPYRIDRMLVHLRRAGWFDGLAGVAVGQFTDCVDEEHRLGAAEVLAEHLSGLGVPVLGGLPVGHGPEQVAVGLGVPARLDGTAGTLTVEPATV